MGSSFLINSVGHYLTVRHVLEAANEKAAETDRKVGLVLKADNGTSRESIVAPVGDFEHAPDPNDVTIGATGITTPTFLTLAPIDVEVWQEVATCGYPIHAVSGNVSGIRLNLRAHRGYIQRILYPADIPLGPQVHGFELDFAISKGLSGAPLFIHRQPKDLVIGLCAGSFRSEMIEDQHVEIVDGNTEFRETRLKIEEYGLAHDLRPLLQWKPSLLGGATLLEAASWG